MPPPDWATNITPRMAEIVGLWANGVSHTVIAHRFSISLPTVDTHLQNARRALGLDHLWQLREVWPAVRGEWVWRHARAAGASLTEIASAAGEPEDGNR